jgi:hypothetical protein
MIVKELQATGVSARFQHDGDSRTWIGERAVAQIAVDLVIGVASNAAWSALCSFFRQRHTSDRVRVRIGRIRRIRTEMSWEWYEVDGPGAEVADALTAIEAPAGQPQQSGGVYEQQAEPAES